MIAKTRAEFPFKVSTKRFTQNYCFEESSWILFPGSSPDYYWSYGLVGKVTTSYARDSQFKLFCGQWNSRSK